MTSDMTQVGALAADGTGGTTRTAGGSDEEIERKRERRLRRMAKRLGFVLNKRREFAAHYGPNYWLFDENNGNPVLHDNGDPRNRSTLDDVEAYLDKAEESAKKFDWDRALSIRR